MLSKEVYGDCSRRTFREEEGRGGGRPGKTWYEGMQGDFRVLNIQHDLVQDSKMEVCYQVNPSNPSMLIYLETRR